MKEAIANGGVIRFATFEVDPRGGELRKSGMKLKLSGQPFQVLAILLERPGEVVTREELQNRLWPDTFVDAERGLNTAINKIREALGDSAESPRFVETIPRRGYRFIGAVQRSIRVESQPTDRIDVRRRWRRIAVPTAVILACALTAVLARSRRSLPTAAEFPAPVPFTAFPGLEIAPTFSPDGSQIAFAWDGNPVSGSKGFDLYVKVIGSENLLRLTHHPSEWISPAWSPDGSQIAFHRVSGADTGLYVVPALGGPERKLRSTHVGGEAVSAISWSPDGKWIAFADSTSGGYAGLFLLSLETLQTTQIPQTEGCQQELSPAFSPSGGRLAYACELEAGGAALYAIALPLGHPEFVRKFSGAPWGIAWAGGGKRLIAAHIREDWESSELEDINLADGSVRKLPFGENRTWPATSLKGDKLAYETQVGESGDAFHNTNIWRLDLLHPRFAPVKLVASTRLQICPQYSPDGKHIAFSSSRGGSVEVWISNADGTNPVQLSNLRNPVSGTPSWSPDSQKIVFDTRYSHHADLYIVDISERQPRKLITNVPNAAVPSWSHDGKWIYFVGGAGSASGKIYRCSPQGGPAIALSAQPGYGPKESPDGETAYFVSNMAGKIVLKVVSTKQPGRDSVVEGLPPVWFWDWTVVPGGIYFVPEAAPETMEYFEFATKRVRRIFETDKGFSVGLSVSADGRWLLYSQADGLDGDIMLVDHFR